MAEEFEELKKRSQDIYEASVNTDFEEFKKKMREKEKEEFKEWLVANGVNRIHKGAAFLSYFTDETSLKEKIKEKLNTIFVINKEIKNIIENI